MLNGKNPPILLGMDGLDSAHCQPFSSVSPDLSQLPASMRAAKRWLVRKGKVPFYPNGKPRSGTLDCQADWDQLGTLEQALAALASGRFDGLGFALGFDGTGYWQGIDLDDVEANRLQAVANSLPGYVEYSPSGQGCHAIGYGGSFAALRANGVEAYSGGRYFTVTGNAIGGELSDLEPFVMAHLEPMRARPAANAPVEPSSSPTQPDVEIVGRLLGNPRHAALHAGDLTAYGGDHSRADLDLCNVLALLGCTPAQTEDIWLASPLGQREKTQRRPDYRERTIAAAFATRPAPLPTIDLSRVSANGRPLFPQPAPPARSPTIIDAGLWEGQPIPPRLYRWNGWIAAGQVTYLGGAGASGKSLFCQQLATCTALGLPFLGIQTMRGVSLYVTCEDDVGELHRRENAICARLRVTLSALRQRLGIACLTGMIGNELATFDRQGVMALTQMYEWLLQAIQSIGAQLVILDNVAHFFSGDENNRHHVAPFIGALNRLASETGAAIILIGHPAKSGNGYSGSTAWENQVRTRLFLQVPQEANGFVPDRDARTLTRAKSNYGRGGETLAFRWHHDAFVLQAELGNDADAAIAANIQAANDDQLFLACLAERLRQGRPVSDRRSPTFAPTVFAKMAESESIGKTRLEAAMDRLFRAGRIERAVLWRDTDKARDIAGLRTVPADPQTVAPDEPPTLLPNTPEPLTQTPPNTHCISNEIDGAASWQPRRSQDEGAAP